tara:strand:+ start:599 stop:1312 length:714 start_codon:yes stop_codon:yes gene_type:complete
MNKIGFIPARSGSIRLKNKNIRIVANRPLIYWTLRSAIKSNSFDKIIFSSDSKKYYQLLLKYLKKDRIKTGLIEFDYREKKYTKNKSKIFDYIKFGLINKFNINENDLIVLMLPTCPLRSVDTIKKSIKVSLKTKKNTFTVTNYSFHVSFALKILGKSWQALFKNSPLLKGNTQGQNQKIYYHPTGLANCLHVKILKKKKNSIYYKSLPIIVNRNESIDIDTIEDLKLASNILVKKF